MRQNQQLTWTLGNSQRCISTQLQLCTSRKLKTIALHNWNLVSPIRTSRRTWFAWTSNCLATTSTWCKTKTKSDSANFRTPTLGYSRKTTRRFLTRRKVQERKTRTLCSKANGFNLSQLPRKTLSRIKNRISYATRKSCKSSNTWTLRTQD